MNNYKSFTLGDRSIGNGYPCVVIAEIAQAHDGSLGAAHAYIDAVARSGADGIKFQTHIANAESTPHEKFRKQIFPQDASRYDYWKRMEFTPEQWLGLANHARDKRLIFLSTPFSEEAVDLLEKLDVPAWKVGSGEIGNLPLITKMALTGKPVLLSSGMSPWSELDAAIECVISNSAPVAVFQCTTEYPCPPEKIGLNVLDAMRERYGCPIGLSDHSGTIYASLAGAALGVDLIEVHAVFSKECFGPDVTSSVTTTELAQLVQGVRFIQTVMKHPVEKNDIAEEKSELRMLFGKSLVATRNLPAGHRLESSDIAIKKPGGGMPPTSISTLIGRCISRDYVLNEFFKEDDLE